jgi:hypothetical protein
MRITSYAPAPARGNLLQERADPQALPGPPRRGPRGAGAVLVRVALALLRVRRRALEKRIDFARFDRQVSYELDGLILSIEALEAVR